MAPASVPRAPSLQNTTPRASKWPGKAGDPRGRKGPLEIVWRHKTVGTGLLLFCILRKCFQKPLANHVYGRGFVSQGIRVHSYTDPQKPLQEQL